MINKDSNFQDIIDKLRAQTGKKIHFATYKFITPRQYGPYLFLKGYMVFDKYDPVNENHVHYFEFDDVSGELHTLGAILLHREDIKH